MSSQTWSRLIRFIDDNGNETFGEPLVKSETELEQLLSSQNLYATEFKGQSPTSELVKGEKVHVKAIRDILTPSDVPIIRCIGLNYIKHSTPFSQDLETPSALLCTNALSVKEGGRTPPPYPSVFIKPSTSIAGHVEDIPIPKVAQDGTVDYEGELVSVISIHKPSELPQD